MSRPRLLRLPTASSSAASTRRSKKGIYYLTSIDAFKEQYAERAGIEGTISQGIWAFELRRSRYIGLARTHLQNVLMATALNFVRVSLWFSETPRATTRQSAFQRLIATAA